MRTNFRQRLKSRIPPEAIKAGLVLLFIGVLSFAAPALPQSVRGAAQYAATPLWHARDNLEAAVFGAVTILASKEALMKENIALYQTISTLRRESFEAGILREENRRLKELLNRAEENTEMIAASVLVRPSLSPYDTLVVDAGSAEGVAVGNVVLAEGSVAIGYVANIAEHSSTVLLFSTPGLSTPVIIGRASTTPALAAGVGSGNFTVRVPRDAPISLNDPVVLPTFSAETFASVAHIERNPTDSFQEIRFRAPINTATVRYVLIDGAATYEPEAYAEETE